MTTFSVTTGVMVPMRDGTLLATDVYRPDGGRLPALLARTPYDKDGVAGWSDDLDLFRTMRAGYAVVVQDVRGRFASGGSFDAYAQEPADGADTISWVAEQPWCTGDVATFGKSYLGCTQWQTAPEQPPALRAMAPSMTPSDTYEGNVYQGGVNLLHVLRWAVGLGSSAAAQMAASGEQIPVGWARDFDQDAALAHLPLGDHPGYDRVAPFWPTWIAHPADGPYWRSLSASERYDRVQVPVLNIGGWYDIIPKPALENFRGVRHNGHPLAGKSPLIMGPWSHVDLSGSFPAREFGAHASRDAIDLDGRQLRWFDRWGKGIANGAEDDGPVTIFVMGTDQWRTESDWPLPDTVWTGYHLHSGGHTNTRSGDGTLSVEAAGAEPADTVLDDPHHPVPTIGGQVLLPGADSVGPKDQSDVEDRDDVLVYTTQVLTEPVEVTGPVELIAYLACTAPDTDLAAKLVDVFPDGRAINLTDGIQRLRYRSSAEEPALMTPGVIYEVHVDLWATANVFLPGHRILLELAGSNFGKFGRNSHTGGDIATDADAAHVPAHTTIHHDSTHPTRLILPIIRR